MVEKVVAYAARDGSKWATEREAVIKEIELDIAEKIPELKIGMGHIIKNVDLLARIFESLAPRLQKKPPLGSAETTLERRRAQVVEQMRKTADFAKQWLTDNGFRKAEDFMARATEAQLFRWDEDHQEFQRRVGLGG